MSSSGNERFAFVTEWVDPQAGITWRYQLLFFVKDNSIEMARAHTAEPPYAGRRRVSLARRRPSASSSGPQQQTRLSAPPASPIRGAPDPSRRPASPRRRLS